MNCPNCNSDHLQKKGMRAGKQRYRCAECGSCFTEGVEYVRTITREKASAECPRCHSKEVLRDGLTDKGEQRYKCEYRFNGISKILPLIEWECPNCGGELRYSGFSRKGNREYKCAKCGRSCTADDNGKPIKSKIPFYLTNKDVKCPYCGSTKINRATGNRGYFIYTCRECSKRFSKKTKIRYSIDKIMELVYLGKDTASIAQEAGYSQGRLCKIIRTYCKNEPVTSKQIADIIKYGYYLNVPIDYLSRYIKCSEGKCKEILEKYKKKVMSTNHGAT